MESIKAQVELITPEIAKEYLKFNTVNRPLNKTTVDYYADQMRRGQWMLNGETICFSDGGVLINGQHRLNAIIKADTPIQMLVVRGVQSESFITFDNGKNRTMADILSLADIPNANNVASVLKRYIMLSRGISVIKSENGVTSAKAYKITKQDMMDCYKSNSEDIQYVSKFAQACTKKLNIMKVSEIGSLYLFLSTEKKHPKEFVESFFRMLFFSENVKCQTINIFREKVVQSKLQSGIKMTSKYKDALFAKTWNAYVTNKELKVLSWNEAREGRIELL